MKKITYFKMMLLAVILVVGSASAWGQTTYGWNGTSVTSTSGSDPNIVSAAFGSLQGNNNGTTTLITSTSASSGYTGASGTSNFGAACKTGALSTSTSTYFTIIITPDANYQISLNSISLGSRSTSTGPTTLTVYSDIDNYTTPIGSATVLNKSTWALSSITFSGISLIGATSTAVTLRIYGANGTGNATAGTANWRIDDISLNVTASSSGSSSAAIPTFSPAAGTYTSAQNITLSSITSEAKIYYTTDGVTTPTSASTPYTGAIALNSTATTTIQAIAYDASNANPSSVASATYTINLNPTMTATETTVPALTAQVGGTPATQTIHISGVNLSDVVNISTNDPQFTVSPTSITPTSGTVTSTAVTITYTPTAAGSITKTLTISSTGATDVTRSLNGTATLKAPVATSATGITNTGFTAGWGNVSGTTGYQLDVYTKSPGPFNEGFAGFTAGTTGSGASGTEVSGSLDSYTQTPGWTGAKVYQAGGATKMGTASSLGSITTPSLDLSGNGGSFNVSFKSMAWSGDATSLKIYLDDVLVNTVTGLSNDATYTLSSFSVDLTGGTSASKIKFEGNTAANGRFFLKDLLISQGGFTKTSISGAPFTVSGSTSQLVSGLNAGTNYYYSVIASDGINNSLASNEISAATTNNSSTVADGSWSSTTTWSDGNVPATGAIVTVNNALTIDRDASVSSVTINPGAQLTLSSGKTLSAINFNINSDATGTGTYVDNGTTSITGTTNVQQYLTGAAGTSKRGYWYIASPVTNATSAVFDPLNGTNYLWYYDEYNNNNGPAYSEIKTNDATLTPGTGYVAYINGVDAVYTFSGTLNNGDITLTPTRTGTSDGKRGFNLIGNPYPSYLDWSAVTKTNVRNTIWYRTYTGTVMEFVTFDGTYSTATPAITKYIPPMQAFWVKVNADGNIASLGLNNSMRSHQDGATNPLRAPSVNSPKVLRLKVSNGTNDDEALVVTNPNATDGYDNYDSPKMSNNNVVIPEIYTLAGSEELVINNVSSINENEELPLGFRTGESNNFTIKATEVNNFDVNTKIILKDNLQNTEQDLTDGTAYTFYSDIATTDSRFSIIFRSGSITTGIDNNSGNNTISVYKNANGQITITCSKGVAGQGIASVYDITGRKLENAMLTSATTVLSKTYTPGIYVVNVIANGKTTTHKLVIN